MSVDETDPPRAGVLIEVPSVDCPICRHHLEAKSVTITETDNFWTLRCPLEGTAYEYRAIS